MFSDNGGNSQGKCVFVWGVYCDLVIASILSVKLNQANTPPLPMGCQSSVIVMTNHPEKPPNKNMSS